MLEKYKTLNRGDHDVLINKHMVMIIIMISISIIIGGRYQSVTFNNTIPRSFLLIFVNNWVVFMSLFSGKRCWWHSLVRGNIGCISNKLFFKRKACCMRGKFHVYIYITKLENNITTFLLNHIATFFFLMEIVKCLVKLYKVVSPCWSINAL